jgi:hypothetical protein
MRILFFLFMLCTYNSQSFAVRAQITNIQIIMPNEQPIAEMRELTLDKQTTRFPLGGVRITVDYGDGPNSLAEERSWKSEEVSEDCQVINLDPQFVPSNKVLEMATPLVVYEKETCDGYCFERRTPLRGKYNYYCDDFYALFALMSESILAKYVAGRDSAALDFNKKVPAKFNYYMGIFCDLIPEEIKIVEEYKFYYKFKAKQAIESFKSKASCDPEGQYKDLDAQIFGIKANLLTTYIEKLHVLSKKISANQLTYADLMSFMVEQCKSIAYHRHMNRGGFNIDGECSMHNSFGGFNIDGECSLDKIFVFYIKAVKDDRFVGFTGDNDSFIQSITKDPRFMKYIIDNDSAKKRVRFIANAEGRHNMYVNCSGIGQNSAIRQLVLDYARKHRRDQYAGITPQIDIPGDVQFEFGDFVIENVHNSFIN